MKISVIIPNYNHEHFLVKRIESVLNQSYRDFEVILLDDCSTDNSWEIMKSYANNEKVSVLDRNDKNSGSPFSQWKKGISLAKGELIWIAESDDYADHNLLQNLIGIYNDEVVVAYCKSIWVDENDVHNKPIPYNPEDRWDHSFSNNGIEEIKFIMGKKNKIPNASAALFRKPQNFPDTIINMKYAGDWYFWIWMLQFGNIAYTPEKLNYFRKHSGSSRQLKSIKDELTRFEENLKVINFGLELQNVSLDSGLAENYRWLATKLHRNLADNTRLSLTYWNPPIPPHFKKMYFQCLLKAFKERLIK
ncbi:MAG TPA: glycosyltransferase family 2 protein [Anditalea sp.]|nr:glycosyltransferase family 2 protein [Anditalea sp.]